MTTVDSSVLIPALSRWHRAHERSAAVVRTESVSVGAHVLCETYSVVTGGALQPRVKPEVVVPALLQLGAPLTLSAAGLRRMLERCAQRGVVGGAVYDALVAATALEADVRLLSRDRRAARTYEAVGADYELID